MAGMTREDLALTSRQLGKRKHIPTKKNLVICYTEPDVFSVYLVDGDNTEYLTDVDGILWKYDTLIIPEKEKIFSIASDLKETIETLKPKEGLGYRVEKRRLLREGDGEDR